MQFRGWKANSDLVMLNVSDCMYDLVLILPAIFLTPASLSFYLYSMNTDAPWLMMGLRPDKSIVS